jgi:DNA repair ATPase RecN
MTEPPEPRDPEEGSGDDELQEFLDSEQFAELGDDLLLDQIGQGEDERRLSDDIPDEEWELQDLLHDWRDDVESEPIPPIAERAQEIHELNQQYDAPPTEGGTIPMSASEAAARLRQIAGDTAAVGTLREALSRLEETMAEIQRALGADHSQLGNALGPFSEANAAALQLQEQIMAAYGNLEAIAGQIG